MWEARAAAGRLDDLVRAVVAHRVSLSLRDGYAGGEVYRADGPDPRVVLITRWTDQAALDQAPEPPGDEDLHARPPHAWDFVPVY
jgi:Antibiotic biosynthesis monooxygenase